MKARITVTLKSGVLDPQGRAIANALHSLGFGSVEDVRQGKLIEVQLKAANEEQARTELDAMCRQLLANTVIENYRVELVGE
ncbi:MAG: phosphoribosylformylglycinamidine synthase subunit PurS [Rhodomicrobium sp.]